MSFSYIIIIRPRHIERNIHEALKRFIYSFNQYLRGIYRTCRQGAGYIGEDKIQLLPSGTEKAEEDKIITACCNVINCS